MSESIITQYLRQIGSIIPWSSLYFLLTYVNQMYSPRSKQSQSNARYLLRKHLNNKYAQISACVSTQDMHDHHTNSTTACSILANDQSTKSNNLLRVNSSFNRGFRAVNSGFVSNSSISGNTKQTIEDSCILNKKCSPNSKNVIGTIHPKQKVNLSKRRSEEKYAKQVKKIIEHFVDRLMPKNKMISLKQSPIKKNGRLSKRSSYQQYPFSSYDSFLVSENEKNNSKSMEEKLIQMQNKTNYFVEQLENIKQLWEKSNILRKELIKLKQSESKNQIILQKELGISKDRSSNQIRLFNEFKQYIQNSNKIELNKTLNQLQTFQKRIVDHLEKLQDRVNRIQQTTHLNNKQFSMKTKQKLDKIINHLKSRNQKLEQDNIVIIKQNQKIHQKLNQLQSSYKHKTNMLQNQIKELKLQANTQRIIEEEDEGSQHQLINLKQQLCELQQQNIKISQQLNFMQSKIDTLQQQKCELNQLVEQYQIREHQSSITNGMMVCQLNDKISSLEKQCGKIGDDSGYRNARVTTVNHSETKIEEASFLPQKQDDKQVNDYKIKINHESVHFEDDEAVFEKIKVNMLESQNKCLDSTVENYKHKLSQKEKQLINMKNKMDPCIISKQSNSDNPSNFMQTLSSYLDSNTSYTSDQKSKIIHFVQKIFQNKSLQNSVLQLNSLIKKQTSNVILSSRTFSDTSNNEQPQPTFMDVFSKFDQRQQSIFRLIDYIGSNLKAGDLLTEIVNQFVMKAIPDKNYEEYEKLTEAFVMKIADYQYAKTKTVDKVISKYIMITEGIFRSKEEIEAALNQSSDDDDEQLDKCLWEEILHPQNKLKEQKIRVPSKKHRKPILMPSIKQFVQTNNHDQPLAVIKQEKKHKANLSLFSEDDSDFYHSHNTPNITPHLTPIKKIIEEQD